MLAELNELFINVQTVSHCILLILDTIKTCNIYHANEQLQSQIVRENEVTRRNHVIRRSVSTFLGSTNCLIILIIRCLSKLNVCRTPVIPLAHASFGILAYPPAPNFQKCSFLLEFQISIYAMKKRSAINSKGSDWYCRCQLQHCGP